MVRRPTPKLTAGELIKKASAASYCVTRVTHAGTIRFQDRLLFLADVLKEHHVGLEEIADEFCSLYLGTVLLGKIVETTMKVYG
jgi:hypothetical protein